MLGGIIPDPPGWGEYHNRWIGRKQVQKTEWAEVDLSFLTDRGGKTDRAGGNDMLEVVLFFLGGEIF